MRNLVLFNRVAGVWLAVGLATSLAGQPVQSAGPRAALPTRDGYEYLCRVMDQYHTRFYVYDDFISAGNHFVERARMGEPGDDQAALPMDEAWTNQPASGNTCIRCRFKSGRNNWGGWVFMNGAWGFKDERPQLNWGNVPNAGVDLRGATRLTFRARGEQGGERVSFFCFGAGRVHYTGKPNQPYPDSAPKQSTGCITLTREWREYTIPIDQLDLRYCLIGFGWQTKATLNDRRDIVFYLDDIGFDKATLDEPRLLISYRTEATGDEFDTVLRNTAFTYDNALALLAFLARGDTRRARLLADALVYAQNHDRYFSDGRLRNAYQGGDLALAPGWLPGGKRGCVRLPGWWDFSRNGWLEDRTMVGTYVGNLAWSMLALLAYYETAGGEEYLHAAERMGLWIEKHCRDTRGAGGYTAGYEGWEPDPEPLQYKATEHNIDLSAAFRRLHQLTGDAAWAARARHAERFVHAMWDAREGKFWTGTGDDGKTVFKEVVPLDIQCWSVLALRERRAEYARGLQYAEQVLGIGDGFDFNQDTDGIWYEGTAQLAAAWAALDQPLKQQQIIAGLKAARDVAGGLPAADREVITTGFHLKDGQPWLYYKRLHVGATAWALLAEQSMNPFWMGSASDHAVAQLNRRAPSRAD